MYDKLLPSGESYQMPESVADAMTLLLTAATLNDDQWRAVRQYPSLFAKSSTVFGENGGRAQGSTVHHNFNPTSGAQ